MEAGREVAAHYIGEGWAEMASTEIHPDPEIVEAIAVRVVELLGGFAPDDQVRLVDAGRVARELGVERDWVYDHAAQLGAIRLGGPRGRLRFDLQVVRDRLGGAEPTSWRPPRRPARRPQISPESRPPVASAPAKIDSTKKSGRGARQRPRPDTGR
jgi:hypothetical protein